MADPFAKLLPGLDLDLCAFTIEVSGTYFTLKKQPWGPWEPDPAGTGRFNQAGTGSIYLGDAFEICKAEVGLEDRRLFQADLAVPRIFDLAAVTDAHSDLARAVLVESGSGGWEPTHEISNYLHANDFAGIRFRSHHDPQHINVVLWNDRAKLTEDAFQELPVPADESASASED